MTNEKIVIEVWSDIVCPFCWMGKRRLERALDATGLTSQFVVVHRPYRLSPGGPKIPILEMMRTKYGLTEERAQRNFDGIKQQGQADGIDFNIPGTFLGDSLDAHRLALWAGTFHRANEMVERLHRAYFTEGRDIFDRAVLIELAIELGLEAQGAKDALNSDRFEKQVHESEAEARSIGVRGVPFFVFKGEHAISGAQPREVFEGLLRELTVSN